MHIEFVHLIRFVLQIRNLRNIYNQKLHKNNFKDKNEKKHNIFAKYIDQILGCFVCESNFLKTKFRNFKQIVSKNFNLKTVRYLVYFHKIQDSNSKGI